LAIVLHRRSFATSLLRDPGILAIVGACATVLAIAAALWRRAGPALGFSHGCTCCVDLAPLAIGVLWRWILAPTTARSAPARPPHRVAHRSRLALPVVSAVVVWTNVGFVTLFSWPESSPSRRNPQPAASTARRRAAVPAHHPADAADDAVIRDGHRIIAGQVFDTVYA